MCALVLSAHPCKILLLYLWCGWNLWDVSMRLAASSLEEVENNMFYSVGQTSVPAQG